MLAPIRQSNTIGSKKNHLSRITGFLLLAHAVFMVVCYAVLGTSVLISGWSLVLILLLDLMLVLALRHTSDQTVSHVLLLAWFVLMFFLPRLTAFLVLPTKSITFVALEPLTLTEVEQGLRFVVPGTLALLIGFEIGGRFSPKSKSSQNTDYSIYGIMLFFLVCLSAILFVIYYLGVGLFGDPANWGHPLGWLALVFNIDAALVVLVCWIVLRKTPSKTGSFLAIAMLVIWLALSLEQGSRGGPLRFLYLFTMAAVAIHGDYMLSARRFVIVICVTLFASAIAYPLATIIRIDKGTSDNAVQQVMTDWTLPGKINVELGSLSRNRQLLEQSEFAAAVGRAVSPVVTRLGLIDYPLFIVNRPTQDGVVEHYLSPIYSLKNFLNNMVPGEIFPGYDIMSSRVFTMAYRGYDQEHVRTAFLSEPWTGWGYSWLLGGPIGGLFLLAAMAAVVQAGYHFARHLSGPQIAPFVSTAWLFVVSMSGLLQMFGLDHWLTISAHFAIAMTLGVAFMLGPKRALQQIQTYKNSLFPHES